MSQKSTERNAGFEWYQRGAKVATAPKKFRKGACQNCGAMTHKKRDCMERPRKVGAWKTGANLAHDEVLPSAPLELNFDGKHDRWNGYDASEFKRVVERYEALEELRKEAAATAEQKKLADEGDAEGADSAANADVDDGFKAESTIDPRAKVTVRNLRNREDTAKYLRNLDVNSAYYDPK